MFLPDLIYRETRLNGIPTSASISSDQNRNAWNGINLASLIPKRSEVWVHFNKVLQNFVSVIEQHFLINLKKTMNWNFVPMISFLWWKNAMMGGISEQICLPKNLVLFLEIMLFDIDPSPVRRNNKDLWPTTVKRKRATGLLDNFRSSIVSTFHTNFKRFALNKLGKKP